jgi:nicotinamidase-related amidase
MMARTLDSQRCAVMAMDFQNEILGTTPQYREKHLLGTVQRVLDTARQAGATIIYITVSFRDDYADAPAHSPLFQDEKARGVMKAGSPGAAICDELTPHAGIWSSINIVSIRSTGRIWRTCCAPETWIR